MTGPPGSTYLKCLANGDEQYVSLHNYSGLRAGYTQPFVVNCPVDNTLDLMRFRENVYFRSRALEKNSRQHEATVMRIEKETKRPGYALGHINSYYEKSIEPPKWTNSISSYYLHDKRAQSVTPHTSLYIRKGEKPLISRMVSS